MRFTFLPLPVTRGYLTAVLVWLVGYLGYGLHRFLLPCPARCPLHGLRWTLYALHAHRLRTVLQHFTRAALVYTARLHHTTVHYTPPHYLGHVCCLRLHYTHGYRGTLRLLHTRLVTPLPSWFNAFTAGWLARLDAHYGSLPRCTLYRLPVLLPVTVRGSRLPAAHTPQTVTHAIPSSAGLPVAGYARFAVCRAQLDTLVTRRTLVWFTLLQRALAFVVPHTHTVPLRVRGPGSFGLHTLRTTRLRAVVPVGCTVRVWLRYHTPQFKHTVLRFAYSYCTVAVAHRIFRLNACTHYVAHTHATVYARVTYPHTVAAVYLYPRFIYRHTFGLRFTGLYTSTTRYGLVCYATWFAFRRFRTPLPRLITRTVTRFTCRAPGWFGRLCSFAHARFQYVATVPQLAYATPRFFTHSSATLPVPCRLLYLTGFSGSRYTRARFTDTPVKFVQFHRALPVLVYGLRIRFHRPVPRGCRSQFGLRFTDYVARVYPLVVLLPGLGHCLILFAACTYGYLHLYIWFIVGSRTCYTFGLCLWIRALHTAALRTVATFTAFGFWFVLRACPAATRHHLLPGYACPAAPHGYLYRVHAALRLGSTHGFSYCAHLRFPLFPLVLVPTLPRSYTHTYAHGLVHICGLPHRLCTVRVVTWTGCGLVTRVVTLRCAHTHLQVYYTTEPHIHFGFHGYRARPTTSSQFTTTQFCYTRFTVYGPVAAVTHVATVTVT